MSCLAQRIIRPWHERRICFMRIYFAFAFSLVATLVSAADLNEVASFPDQQVTGVGVSTKSGRIFVNFPYWSDQHSISVAEIVNGQPKPFPNDEWNKPGPPAHFVCVQSVVVDDQDNLWVLNPAAPKMQEIVKRGPKLAKIHLRANQLLARSGRSQFHPPVDLGLIGRGVF
jgi:hypothetical protein